MYQALLTRKYLTSKIMPLLASLAVLLCTAMVLITWSVMGGFLSMLLDSGRKTIGDAAIRWPNIGFAHYEELVGMLEEDPLIGAACPLIETFAVVVLPDDRVQMISLRGISGASYGRVIDYDSLLYWRPVAAGQSPDAAEDIRTDPEYAGLLDLVLEGGQRLARRDATTGEWTPGLVLGIHMTDYNRRRPSGVYVPHYPLRPQADGSSQVVRDFMPVSGKVTLHLLPLDSSGRGVGIETRVLPVANEFRTGVYEIDRQSAFIEMGLLQRVLGMGAAERVADSGSHNPFEVRVDPVSGRHVHVDPTTIVDPARATTVLIRAASPSTPSIAIKERAQEIYARFAERHAGQVPPATSIVIETWEEQNATLVAAVRKETGLVLFIFAFISMTAVFLVLAIFWSMIAEKTKDIGVLRALGAGRLGVAWLWIRYGLAIGAVGSLLGGLAAVLVVRNINAIHDWMGEALNMHVWDPAIYYFSQIPARVDPLEGSVVVGAGVLSSLVGALIPAWRAARLDPVRALRFE